MLTRRNKDGESNGGGDRSSKKIISASPEEFDEALATLVQLALDDEQRAYRIYATADIRDFEKGIREFKRRQLEADYADHGSRHGFYRDSFNRVVSSLQQPGARATSLFLWDCDSKEEYEQMRQVLYGCGAAAIVHAYETKNGGHIITAPFEYPRFINPELHHLLKKNAMMLWGY